jgi:membrane protease YdiL (CAAX protease family)
MRGHQRLRALGILASAVVFGAGHLYQGWRSVILITVYGLLFGVLAHLVRSLRPGMIVHAWQDMFSGLYSG